MYERFGPKYVVQWQTEFDSSSISPQEAALEALRELKTNNPFYSASGEAKDREYTRRKRLKNRIEKRRAREKEAKLGTFGAASSVRSVK